MVGSNAGLLEMWQPTGWTCRGRGRASQPDAIGSGSGIASDSGIAGRQTGDVDALGLGARDALGRCPLLDLPARRCRLWVGRQPGPQPVGPVDRAVEAHVQGEDHLERAGRDGPDLVDLPPDLVGRERLAHRAQHPRDEGGIGWDRRGAPGGQRVGARPHADEGGGVGQEGG